MAAAQSAGCATFRPTAKSHSKLTVEIKGKIIEFDGETDYKSVGKHLHMKGLLNDSNVNNILYEMTKKFCFPLLIFLCAHVRCMPTPRPSTRHLFVGRCMCLRRCFRAAPLTPGPLPRCPGPLTLATVDLPFAFSPASSSASREPLHYVSWWVHQPAGRQGGSTPGCFTLSKGRWHGLSLALSTILEIGDTLQQARLRWRLLCSRPWAMVPVDTRGAGHRSGC